MSAEVTMWVMMMVYNGISVPHNGVNLLPEGLPVVHVHADEISCRRDAAIAQEVADSNIRSAERAGQVAHYRVVCEKQVVRSSK